MLNSNFGEMNFFELLKTFNSKTLFKLVVFCTAGFYVPIMIIFGLLAMFDIVPANLNDKNYTGVIGFLIYILMAPVYISILAVTHWIILAIGLKIAKVVIRLFAKRKLENEKSV